MRRSRAGNTLMEFTLIGLPVIFITISIIDVAIDMWQYNSMMLAVETATRYACMHGRTCTQNGNTCTITLGDVTTMIASQAPALDTSRLSVTLRTNSATTTCNPVSSCMSSSTQFPSATDNAVNLDIKISGTYPVRSPLPMFWTGAGSTGSSTYSLTAQSRQRIVY